MKTLIVGSYEYIYRTARKLGLKPDEFRAITSPERAAGWSGPLKIVYAGGPERYGALYDIAYSDLKRLAEFDPTIEFIQSHE